MDIVGLSKFWGGFQTFACFASPDRDTTTDYDLDTDVPNKSSPARTLKMSFVIFLH